MSRLTMIFALGPVIAIGCIVDAVFAWRAKPSAFQTIRIMTDALLSALSLLLVIATALGLIYISQMRPWAD